MHPAIRRINPDDAGEKIYAVLIAQSRQSDPAFAKWLEERRDAVVPMIGEQVRKRKAAKKAGKSVKKVKMIPPSKGGTIPFNKAVQRVGELVTYMTGLGAPKDIDNMGFNKPDWMWAKQYMGWADFAKDAAVQPHLDAVKTLIKYGKTQLDMTELLNLVRSLEIHAAKRGEIVQEERERVWHPEKGKTDRNDRYKWQGGPNFKFLVPFKRAKGAASPNKALLQAGFEKGRDFHWDVLETPTGKEFWIVMNVGKAEEAANALEAAGFEAMAGALRANAPVWVDHVEKVGDIVEEVAEGEIDLKKGVADGVRWVWDPEKPSDVYFSFPYWQGRAREDQSARTFTRARIPYKSMGKENDWLMKFHPKNLGDVADLLTTENLHPRFVTLLRTTLMPAFLDAVELNLSPEEEEARNKRARSLMRRFRHQMDPRVVQERPEIAEESLTEVADLLGLVEPGANEIDLGAYGAWKISTNQRGQEMLMVSAPYGHDQGMKDKLGARRSKDRQGRWWSTVPLKKAPMAARTLDYYNLPLAMSIRLGLLTDQMSDPCIELEELASAPSMKDIPDPKLRAQVAKLLKPLKFPKGLKPYPYQCVGIAYAYLTGFRALIGDNMGLGKTIQAIGAIALAPDKLLPTLVIAPSNVVYKWRAEINKWLPNYKVSIIEKTKDPLPPLNRQGKKGIGRLYDIVIGSWDQLRLMDEELIDANFQLVIFDESHYAKNPTSQRSKVAAALAHNAPHVLLLSGTAMENRPKELWHQLYMIDPDEFSKKKDFDDKFTNPKKRVVKVKKKTETGETIQVRREFTDNRGATHLDELRDTLRCYMIRRLKDEVLTELPPKIRSTIQVKLSKDAMKAYEDALTDLEDWLCTTYRNRALKLGVKIYERVVKQQGVQGALFYATNAANEATPEAVVKNALVKMGHARRLAGEAKVPAAAQWITDFLDTGEPLVVFYEHKNVKNQLAPLLDKAIGADRWTFIDGSIGAEEKFRRVQAFQNGDVDVILSSKAGREGIDLVRATNLLFVEYWWVPAQMEQAEDRIHRATQKGQVTIYYLLGLGTFDEHVDELIQGKKRIIRQVMGEEFADQSRVIEEIEGGIESDLGDRLLADVMNRIALGEGGDCKIDETDLLDELVSLGILER
jgi:superfamily II DNA or RNA helicase